MAKTGFRYLCFLLRLWQVGGAEEPAWRASLERADTRERYGFADLDALLEFLKNEAGGCGRPQTASSELENNGQP